MFDDRRGLSLYTIISRVFERCFLLLCLMMSSVAILVGAQETDVPLPESVSESVSEPTSEPLAQEQPSQPEPIPEFVLEPSSEPVSGSNSESKESSSSDGHLPASPGDPESSPLSNIPDVPSSSLTLLETGEGVIPLLEGAMTPETEEILSVFSDDDVFVEVELIVSEGELIPEMEILDDLTLVDNTDEDPNVDLIDPSIIPNPPGPEPEPATELPPEDTSPVVESAQETHSTIALLEQLLSAEEEPEIRRYDKIIEIDPNALHTCRADIFRADIKDETYSRAQIFLAQNTQKSLPSFLEIGSLPTGIDVVFKNNNDYYYMPDTRETRIEFEITRQIGAEEGDFSIPIIYTLQGEKSSSVVCQINIIND